MLLDFKYIVYNLVTFICWTTRGSGILLLLYISLLPSAHAFIFLAWFGNFPFTLCDLVFFCATNLV